MRQRGGHGQEHRARPQAPSGARSSASGAGAGDLAHAVAEVNDVDASRVETEALDEVAASRLRGGHDSLGPTRAERAR